MNRPTLERIGYLALLGFAAALQFSIAAANILLGLALLMWLIRAVTLRRRAPVRRPLNVPRHYFSRRGLESFHRLPPRERVERMRTLIAPSYPKGAQWDEPLERAAREGRFRVEPSLNGSTQVICATGFRRGFRHDPLLARLAADHDLETEDVWLVLDPDSSVPRLTDETRTLAVAGAPAQWAFPAADTLAGARYAAHRFLGRIKACRTR